MAEMDLQINLPDDVDELAEHAALRGNLEAFNRLALKLQDSVFGLAYSILSDPADAEDATQAAFLSAYLHLKSFRGGSFKAWILRIVTNICYDRLRRVKRYPQVSIDGPLDEDGESFYDLLPDSLAPAPEDAAQQRAMIDSLRDCLDKLPDDYRTVTMLVDINGLDYHEASQVIDRPVGTVKSRVARARMHLRRCMVGSAGMD